ncbi:DUF4350 domain-containing protein [Haloarchaeobius sp. TZWSO28]|uniref:DUF4350 domain-containing protein n=1 Tax=Haloarchaeobius sp. TZWSO28 TaxID=3446119 RepID=UPI003EC01A50
MRIAGRTVRYPQLLVVGLLVLLVGAGLWAGVTSADAFGAYNPAWDGSQDARTIVGETDRTVVVAQETGEYETLDANETTAFVLSPTSDYGPAAEADLRNFVRDGGTLVVAGDFGGTVNPLLSGIGADARLDGTTLRDEQHYTESPAMPLATNVSDDSRVADVDELALNYATVVDPGTESTVLVRSSPYGYLDANGNEALDDNETLASYPVVVTESVGEGQVVLVSDPSVFINTMLDRGDNRAFLSAIVGESETVLFDYSHAGQLPPLVRLTQLLADSALALLVTGLLLLVGGTIAVRGLPVSVPVPWGRGSPSLTAVTLDEASITDLLERRHPEWEHERVRRVAKSINRPSENTVNDE